MPHNFMWQATAQNFGAGAQSPGYLHAMIFKLLQNYKSNKLIEI